jgi:hypothetical protein
MPASMVVRNSAATILAEYLALWNLWTGQSLICSAGPCHVRLGDRQMTTMGKAATLACFCLCFAHGPGLCQGADQAVTATVPGGVAVSGLTKTLGNLLAAKPGTQLSTGSYAYQFEDLVAADLAAALDCDDLINEYLDREGDLFYEELASLIEERIRERLGDGDESLFVIVDASAEGSLMDFSFDVERERRLSLPIEAEAGDGSFRASCVVDCLARLKFSAGLRVDAALVLAGDSHAGVELSLGECSLSLRSLAAGRDEAVPVDERDGPESSLPAAVEASYAYAGSTATKGAAFVGLSAWAGWYLDAPGFDTVREEGEPIRVTFAAISAGGFSWSSAGGGWLRFRSASADADEQDLIEEGGFQFAYAADDIVGGPVQAELRVFAGEWSTLAPGPARPSE